MAWILIDAASGIALQAGRNPFDTPAGYAQVEVEGDANPSPNGQPIRWNGSAWVAVTQADLDASVYTPYALAKAKAADEDEFRAAWLDIKDDVNIPFKIKRFLAALAKRYRLE